MLQRIEYVPMYNNYISVCNINVDMFLADHRKTEGNGV